MKALVIFALCILPFAALALSRTDYESAMRKFMTYYNGNDAKGIRNMFSASWGEQTKNIWSKDQLSNIRSGYGKMISCTYVTIDTVSDDNRLALFKVVCERRTFMTAFDLDKQNKFGTFRFNTSSPFIDSLLRR